MIKSLVYSILFVHDPTWILQQLKSEQVPARARNRSNRGGIGRKLVRKQWEARVAVIYMIPAISRLINHTMIFYFITQWFWPKQFILPYIFPDSKIKNQFSFLLLKVFRGDSVNSDANLFTNHWQYKTFYYDIFKAEQTTFSQLLIQYGGQSVMYTFQRTTPKRHLSVRKDA